jgi:Protein of unknown function (DUF2804)
MSAPLDQPYRGSGADRPVGVPLPPAPMPLLRAGTLRKRWRYATFWSPEVVVCAARVHVGPLGQEYWGVWDRRARRSRQRTRWLARRIELQDRRLTIEDGDVSIDLPFVPDDEFEVYRPEGGGYIWSRKQFCARATATVRLGSTTWRPQGAAFVDVNAGYHPRHTRWRWSAGAGIDQHGRAVAWNAIVGLFDTPRHSERTIWIDGVPSETGPVGFSADLRTVTFGDGGEISFRQEANLRKWVGLLLIRTRYDHAFGAYEGTLPGGLQLRNAVGVRERQDALW